MAQIMDQNQPVRTCEVSGLALGSGLWKVAEMVRPVRVPFTIRRGPIEGLPGGRSESR